MSAGPPCDLVIDARPRGPRGLLAIERVQGRTVLDHLLDLAESVAPDRLVAVLVGEDDLDTLGGSLAARPSSRFVLDPHALPEGLAVIRADRLYDPSRLKRALRRGGDPESAVIWRLDRPGGLVGAEDELVRRRGYQPLGRYWALDPARRLSRALAPTWVRPNAVTLAASALFLGAASVAAFARPTMAANIATASALALALVLDTADGHLARLQGTASEFGRWLDSWLDEVGDMALHAAAAWSAYARSGSSGWLLLGMLYAMGKYVFVAGTTPDAPGIAEATPGNQPSPAVQAVRLAGHADVRWHLWILLAACGRLDAALAAYAVYFPARALLGAARKAVRRG